MGRHCIKLKQISSISLSQWTDFKYSDNFSAAKQRIGGNLCISAKEKERPFLSPVGSCGISGSNQEHNGTKKKGEAEGNSVLDLVFEKFKCTGKETEDALDPCDDVEFGSSNTDMQNARKRKNPFEGEDGKQSERKHLVVLGEVQPKQTCPLPKQKGKEQSTNKKPKHQFNHYANGCGWWDCNMEGVDNEEVGCSEVWEGIGSATLGGLDWH
ncbi:hypothetical protein U1Q18_030770 [Sarracenia purpurea var. burkii]